MNIFFFLFYQPVLNALIAIYKLLISLHVPSALGFSIIILTIIVRFILYPFTKSQIKASKKAQELAPHLSRIKDTHKGDAKRVQEETMKLYKEHGVNPAAGCLTSLVQIPILIWGLYPVFTKVAGLNPRKALTEVNKVMYSDGLKLQTPWDPHFLGIPIGTTPAHLFSTNLILALSVPLITAALQFTQSKMMFAQTPKQEQALAVTSGQEKKPDDFATTFQKQSIYMFPLMIGILSYTFPIGLSLYWNTFTVFGILQQYKMQSKK